MKPPAEDVIFKLLTSDVELRKLVDVRVFPEVAPDGTEDPWIAYQRIGSSDDATSHDGFDDLTEPTYQVTGWSADARTRKLLRGHLLRLFRQQAVDLDGVHVVLAVVDDRDLSDDGPPRYYGCAVDISVAL